MRARSTRLAESVRDRSIDVNSPTGTSSIANSPSGYGGAISQINDEGAERGNVRLSLSRTLGNISRQAPELINQYGEPYRAKGGPGFGSGAK